MTESDRRTQFLATLASNAGETDAAVARRICGWADDHGLREFFVPANVHGEGFSPAIPGTAKDTVPISVTNLYPHVFLAGESLKRQNPFSIEERYAELIQRLYVIPEGVCTRSS